MNHRRATLGVAAAGVLAGAVGLGVLATPAGAGQAPSLPAITPQALVQSVMTAKPVAMGGTVAVENNLGLPAIPDLPSQLTSGNSQFRVWTDGAGRFRAALPDGTAEQTYVDNGTTLYNYSSTDRTVVERSVGTDKTGQRAHVGTSDGTPITPAAAAQELVTAVDATSTIAVTGTDQVAGRSVYDLVLTPKPTEKTLLREVQIAVDSQTRIPLQLTVYANGASTPAVQIGFSSVSFGAQDPSLFQFTPPAGSAIQHDNSTGRRMGEATDKTKPTLVGTGWDTVVVATMPSQTTGQTPSGSPSQTTGGPFGSSSKSSGDSMLGLVQQFGTPVSGSWGHGWLISTSVGGALITSDGRVAIGFVPVQVLEQALAGSK